MEKTVESLVRVNLERLEDTVEMSLRVGELGKLGEPGPLDWWLLKLIHLRVKRESSE